MDSDVMLYVNMDTIVQNYNFISVNSSCHPGTIFQGILGASPKNEIIKKALYKAYNTDPIILNTNYHYFCKQLYDIIKENTYEYNIKLYQERRIDPNDGDDIFEGNTIVFKHYWLNKIIPINENISYITNFLKNKTYTWESSYIKFLDNFKMDAFGEGHYKLVNKQNIVANFGGRVHNISFNHDLTSFISTRIDDLQIITGNIVN